MLRKFKDPSKPTLVGFVFFLMIMLQACSFEKSSSSDTSESENPEIVNASFTEVANVSLEMDTISFALDNKTDGYTTSLQYVDDGRPALSLYNKMTHSIDLYDFVKGEMYERIFLEKEGPNGVGPSPVGVWFLSADSIVVSNKYDLFLINREAEVLKRFRLNMRELGGYPDIILKTTHPIIKIGDKLIASVYPQKDVFKYSDLKRWKNFVEFDLKTSEMRVFGDLPSQMQEKILGFNYVDKSYIFNGEEMILSFFPCKDLYRMPYPFNDEIERVEVDSPNFKDVEEMKNKSSSDFMNYTKHFLMNNSFDGIYFNGTHYLRINQKAISEDELNKRKWAKWKVLQVFDKDFNLLLEKDLESKYGNYLMTIPFEDSFLIAIGRDQEDVMNFARLSIVE